MKATCSLPAFAHSSHRPYSSLGISGFRSEAIRYFFRSLPIFEDIPEQDLRSLADAAVLRPLEKDAYLFHKNEVAPGLYFVRRGIINFHRVAEDGREVVIHFYREGEMLAELASSGDEGCPADARAVLPSEVVVIPKRSFLAELRQCPEFALRLLASIDTQFHQLADSLEGFVSQSAETRFVQWLLRRCEDGTEAAEVQLGTTKRALASELGVRQETLSRTLRHLTDSGYLRVHGRRITIRNPKALRASCFGDLACAAAA